MSLRCVGQQLLQTAPSLRLDGASTASASFWVQVNPGNNVTAAGGVEILGDSGGRFSATLMGSSSLQLQWSFLQGSTAGVSTWALTLMPGKSYHVATTWQAGSQRYYLNGVQVGSDSKAGTLGTAKGSAPLPFRLGSDQAGTDVTLDQPTVWVGYALTSQDVVALCGRSAQPGGIASASIALAWSLAGPDGVSAQIGDNGLTNLWPTGLNLTKVVGAAPTYRAAALTYVPSPTIGQATATSSGQSIVLIAQDGTGVNSGITSITSANEIQSLQFTEAPTGGAFSVSFDGHSTAPVPITTTPPESYGLWTIPTVAGHSYDIATTFLGNYYSVAEYCFETIEGTAVVARQVYPGGTQIPNDPPLPGFNDPGVNWPCGTPVPWMAIAAGIVATSSTLQIRVTGSLPNGFFDIDGLRVHDATAGTITYYDDAGPNLQCFPANNGRLQTGQGQGFDGTYTIFGQVSGVGPIVTITGGAPALQSALEALPSIGSGNVLVEDLGGSIVGSYLITFAGTLANAPRDLITCTDPNVTIAQVNTGGLAPSLSINGGPALPLYDWVWTEASPLPYAFCPLPQSAPASQTCIVGQLPYYQSNNWDGEISSSSSVSGAPLFGFTSGLSMGFLFEELSPATYQIAVTYPNGPFTQGNTSYLPSAATQFLVEDGNGNILATVSVDQTQAPADYQSDGHGWKVIGSFTTNPSQTTLNLVMTTTGLSTLPAKLARPVAILDAVQLNRTSPDTSVTIQSGETATLSIPTGWMATQAGSVPAISSLPIAPPSPTAILPPFVDGPKTLKAGYNVEPADYGSTFVTHSNMAYLMPATWNGVLDANGHPIKLIASRNGNGAVEVPVIQNGIILAPDIHPDYGDPRQGTAVINTGLYVMTWDGDASVTLVPGYTGTTITEVSSTLTGTVGNRRVYNIQVDPNLVVSPAIWLQLQTSTPDPTDPTGSLYLINLSNLVIYPPDPTDPTGQTIWVNPPKFHPWFLNKLQGMQSLRFLDPLSINNNPAALYSHYKPVTHADRCTPTISNKSVGVATMRAPATPYFVIDSGLVEIEITTTAPHGLFDGCILNFSGCGTAEFVGGSLPLDSTFAAVHVIDAQTITCAVGGGKGTVMTNALSGGTLLARNYGTPWPLQDIVDLVVAVGATDLWFNLPITIDVTPGGGAYQVASFLASALPPGVKVHVEPGNECWNAGFFTYFWCSLQNARIIGSRDGTYEVFYANQAKSTHDQFAAAFAMAGRAGNLARVFGTLAVGPNITDQLFQQARSLGATVDELCVALYPSCGPVVGYSTDQLPILDRMTTDQSLDYVELNAVYGGYPDSFITCHLPALQANGYGNVKMTAYEGAIPLPVPIDPVGSLPPGTTPNFALRLNATRRHPRIYPILLQFLQSYQDAGLTLWNYFNLGGGTTFYGWETYESGNMQRGTGNLTTDTLNVTNPNAKNQVLSEVGGAWHYWASLYQSPTASTNPTPILLRNGRIKSTGLPRGTYQTIDS